MILATKTGWLIACTLVRETPKAFVIKPVDSKTEQRVSKNDESRKLFAGVDDATRWIRGGA